MSSRSTDDTVGSLSHPLALLLVLMLAAAPRFAWYLSHQPDLPPDSYGYLNVAREWRGERAPAGAWDDRSQLPWDNQATRTPGYALFLDLVFAASGHSPTPEAALVAPRRILVPGTDVREHHFKHLQTDENVRAVQAAQHILAVAATGIAFLTVILWNGSALAGVVGSLVAIGWNPVWIVTYEPSVMGEILSGALLVVAVWLVSIRPASVVREHVAAATCGLAVIVRPAMLFASLPILAYLVWRRRHDPLAASSVLVAPAFVLALLFANNGLRYGYWGVTSVAGATLLSHASEHPEGLRDPVRQPAEQFRGDVFGGQPLQYVLSVKGHRRYLDATGEINRAALWFIVDHPRWYFASVASAVADFFSPPLQLVPGSVNVVRNRFPLVWHALSACAVLLMLAGFAALLVRVPAPAKLGPAVFLVSAIGTALMANTENGRFAAPLVPLVLMSGVTVLHQVSQRSVGRQPADPR